VPISIPQRHLTIEGKRLDLDAQQYDELVQLSGKPAKQYLDELIRSPEWRSMTDVDGVEAVKNAMADFRDPGRAALLERPRKLALRPRPRCADDGRAPR